MTSPSLRVVRSVAEAEGVDPTDIEPVLAEVVDPQALDALFDGREGTTGHVYFGFKGYDVTVRSDGTVEISESPGSPAESSI
jgi:hypothetical protein